MAAHPYCSNSDFDGFHRTSHRPVSESAIYDRSAPYALYEYPHHESRSEYVGRQRVRTSCQEPESEQVTTGGQPRRRITIACSRCRRRKIKCSGDLGNGSGCSACRQSGADASTCTFVRVNSAALEVYPMEPYPQASNGDTLSQPNSFSGALWGDSMHQLRPHAPYHQPHARPSLPTLHTRGLYFDNIDQYEDSPTETYTYNSAPISRQDSFASTYGPMDSYRPCSSSSPLIAPVTAGYYDQQHSTYNFGALKAPAYGQTIANRLPTVTSDAFTPLNMGSLHLSLPTQTVQERRLPMPVPNLATPSPQYQQALYSSTEVPEIRPLGPFGAEPRVHINGIHSRNAMPWSADSITAETRTAPVTGISYTNGLPRMPALCQSPSTPVSEPGFGYQISVSTTMATSSSSREATPTVTSSSDSFSNHITSTYPTITKRPGVANFQYFADSMSHSQSLPSMDIPDENTSTTYSSQLAPMSSLYSFSTDTDDPRPSTSSSEDLPTFSSGESLSNGHAYASSLRHSHSHHVASVEALRRQASFDQQQRAQTTQRMSVSNLNKHY